jgi:hypothetical protein
VKPKHGSRDWTKLNARELAAATAEFDREFVIDEFKPLTPAQRRQWNRIRRRAGRPRVGRGAKVVSVSIERSLLEEADRFCRRKRVSRALLIALGLRTVLAEASRHRRRRAG